MTVGGGICAVSTEIVPFTTSVIADRRKVPLTRDKRVCSG